MDDTVRERRPGTLVTICGLGVAALTLFVVYLLEEADFSVMGFYLNAIIPAGALFVGCVSGLGFAISSRLLQVKLTSRYAWGMVLTGLLTYWCAQYVTYSQIIERAQIPAQLYPFTSYVQDSCEQMAFRPDKAGDKPRPLGGWGYLFKFLEMAGYVAGSTFPALYVSKLPYCGACQKYLKSYRHGYLHGPEAWADIKKLGKAERTAALERSISAIGTKALEGAQLLASASLAETEAFIAGLAPQADNTLAARVRFAVDKCPTCDAHLIKLTMENYKADKGTASTYLTVVDRIETAGSPPTDAAGGTP